MSILVTGGAGYIGSQMVWELLDNNHDVVVVDDLSTGNRGAIPADVKLIVGNIGNKELIKRVIAQYNVDAIMHFSGSTIVPDSIADPLSYYQNNTANSCALIEMAVKGNVRHFIFSSTAAVYGNAENSPVSEETPPNPASPYGTSKLMTETMLKDICMAHDFRYVALRYFNVAGADLKGRAGQSSPKATHLIKVATQTALGLREKLYVYGNDYNTPDGTCIRDYIHVSDLVAAHFRALEYLRSGGRSTTLNCGIGQGYSVLEIVEAVKKVSAANFQVELGPRRLGDPAILTADIARIKSEICWQPKIGNIEKIVSDAFTWEKHLMATSSNQL